MKKIITFLLILFIGINIANADSIKCTYQYGVVRYVISYKTGDTDLKRTVESSASIGQVTSYVKIADDFTVANFTDNNGNLKCLDKVYQKSSSSGPGGIEYVLTTEYTEINSFGQTMVIAFELNEELSETINDKPEEPKDDILPCTYTSGGYKITVYYNKTKDTITYEGPKGYEATGSLKTKDFANGKCPSNDKYKIFCNQQGGKICVLNENAGAKADEPVTEPNADKIKEDNEKKEANSGGAGGKNGVDANDPSITGFGNTGDECKQVLGETLSALVKEVIKWVRIFGGIIAIVNATLKLVPAIMSKDAEALNKALKTCVIMAIILVFCILFGWMLNLIGKLFKWDVTCIV